MRTLENVTPLFFHLILVRWKNNRVTFSNVFYNGELEFAIIFFYVSLARNREKMSRSRPVSAGLSFKIYFLIFVNFLQNFLVC